MYVQLAAWRLGLKTGMYYMRTRPAVTALPFGVDLRATIARPTPSQGRSIAVAPSTSISDNPQDGTARTEVSVQLAPNVTHASALQEEVASASVEESAIAVCASCCA